MEEDSAGLNPGLSHAKWSLSLSHWARWKLRKMRWSICTHSFLGLSRSVQMIWFSMFFCGSAWSGSGHAWATCEVTFCTHCGLPRSQCLITVLFCFSVHVTWPDLDHVRAYGLECFMQVRLNKNVPTNRYVILAWHVSKCGCIKTQDRFENIAQHV